MLKRYNQYIKESLLDKITGPDINEIHDNFINGRTNILNYNRILNDAGLRISEDILNIGFKKGYIGFGLYLQYASDNGYDFLPLDELKKIDFRRTQTYHILQKSLNYGYLDGVKYVCEDIDKNEYDEYRRANYWDYNYNVLLNNLDIIKYLNGKGFLNRWNNDILLKSAILIGNHPDVLEYVLNKCDIDKTISEIELSNPVIRNDIDTIRILMKHGYYKDREKYLNKALRYKYNDLAEIFLNESLLNKIKGPSEEEIINHLSNLSPDEMLYQSAKIGYLNGVKKAIELGANIESDKSAALYISTKNGNLEIVKYLIENGADINGNNHAAIINAVENNHLDVVKYLVDNGADINYYSNDLLGFSLWLNNMEMVHYLEDKMGIKESLLDKIYGPTDDDIIKYNLDNKKYDKLLFYGLDGMKINIIKIALDNGAKINKINPDKFNTLLNNLYKNNEIEFLYRCIKLYGINGNYNTCYYLSCKYGYLDGVKVALEKHKINASDDFYSLKLAIKYNHLNIVKYLIERFSSTEDAYKWEKAAKDYAYEFNNNEVLDYLLYRGY